MDLTKLSTSEKVIGASGIVLLLASFLPWFSVDLGQFGEASGNGWDMGFLFGPLPVLLGLVMVAHVAISNFMPDLELPELPWPMVHMVAGILAAVLVVLKLLIGEDDGTPVVDIDVDRAFGLFLATLAAIGLGVGGFLYRKEHGADAAPAAGM